MEYQTRICCFIDILGFKNYIAETLDLTKSKATEKIDSIYNILNLAKRLVNTGTNHPVSKQVTYFSDSIVISYLQDEASGVYYNLLDLLYISFEFANKGFLIRGGVSSGLLVHTEEVVFGPALNKAYHLENEIAKNPRIVVPQEIIKIGKQNRNNINSQNDEEEYIMDILSLDDDGEYYIDYVSKSLSEFNDVEYDPFLYLNNLKKLLVKNYSSESIEVFKGKIDWLRDKVNSQIEIIHSNMENGSYPQEVKELYLSLKPI